MDNELKQLVKEFFDDYLDYKEMREDGSFYYPIHISCGRVMKMQKLNDIMKRMKELSHEE